MGIFVYLGNDKAPSMNFKLKDKDGNEKTLCLNFAFKGRECRRQNCELLHMSPASLKTHPQRQKITTDYVNKNNDVAYAPGCAPPSG